MAGFAELSDAQLAAIVPCPPAAGRDPARSSTPGCGPAPRSRRGGWTTRDAARPARPAPTSSPTGPRASTPGSASCSPAPRRTRMGRPVRRRRGQAGQRSPAGWPRGSTSWRHGTEKSAPTRGSAGLGREPAQRRARQSWPAAPSKSADGAEQLSSGLRRLSTGAENWPPAATSSPTGWPRVGDELPSYTAAERSSCPGSSPFRCSRPSPSTIYSDVATTTFLGRHRVVDRRSGQLPGVAGGVRRGARLDEAVLAAGLSRAGPWRG